MMERYNEEPKASTWEKGRSRRRSSFPIVKRVTSGGARIYEEDFDETIPVGPASTVVEMFLRTVEQHRNRPAALICEYESSHRTPGSHKRIRQRTYQELHEEVVYVSLALRDESDDGPGIKLVGGKDRVGVLSPNRWEWTVSDLAIQANGCANISILEGESPFNMKHVLSQTRPRVVLVNSREQMKVLQELGLLGSGDEGAPDSFIEHVVVMDGPIEHLVETSSEEVKGYKVHSYKELIERGLYLHKRRPTMFSEMASQVSADDISAIHYSSGTTGLPKIFAFTDEQITRRMEGYVDLVNVPYEGDVMLAPIGFGWSYSRHTGHYLSLRTGRAVAYSDTQTMWEDMKEFKPTFANFVPRMLEKERLRLMDRWVGANRVRTALFEWSMKVGGNVLRVPYHRLSPWNKVRHWIADLLVLRHLRNEFGGRMRYLISAGARLDPEIATFFEVLGLPVIQYYAGGEFGIVARCTPQEGIKPGTCGPLARRLEVEIDGESQICVHAPWVITEYLYASDKDRQRTEHFLYQTGDQGEFDEDGFLVLKGRKEAITLNTARKVYPQEVEKALRSLPVAQDILFVGDDLPCLILIVNPQDRNLDSVMDRTRKRPRYKEQRGEEAYHSEYATVLKKAQEKIRDQVIAHLRSLQEEKPELAETIAHIGEVVVWSPLDFPKDAVTTTGKLSRETFRRNNDGFLRRIASEVAGKPLFPDTARCRQ